MRNVTILSNNEVFALDLKEQIEKTIQEAEVSFEYSKDAEMLLIDEDINKLQEVASKNTNIPIVFFANKENEDIQADVVIQKPFILSDFLKKISNNTLFPKVRRKEIFSFKEYNVYPIKKEIVSSLTGDTVKLTEKEVKILKYLYQHVPNSVSKEDLLKNVWEYSADVTTHTIETHIYRLRQKVEQKTGSQIIITENNGYKLNK